MKTVRVNLAGVANLPLEALHAFQEDIKILTDERYESLKEEILQDGFSFSPHVFFDSEGKAWILDGHQRRTCLERMKEEGYDIPLIPCMEVEAQDLEHARRLVLAGTSQYGTFQPKKVAEFVKKTGIDSQAVLQRFHLPEVQLKKLVVVDGYLRGGAEGVDPNPVLDPKTKLGQVYQLGRHRLMCGDSSVKADVEKLTNGGQVHMLFTDPPYGVSAGGARSQTVQAKGIQPIANDELRGQALEQFLVKCLKNAPLRQNGSFYVCYDQKTQLEFVTAFRELGWTHRATIVWNKNNFGLSGHKGYRPKYELIAFGHFGGDYEWHGGNDQADVWDVPRPRERPGNHPTPKPVELVERAINNSSSPGHKVLDLFAGVGSTIIACEVTGRVCHAMELSPAYCDVIVERWEKLTGKKAELIQ